MVSNKDKRMLTKNIVSMYGPPNHTRGLVEAANHVPLPPIKHTLGGLGDTTGLQVSYEVIFYFSLLITF